MSIGSLDFQTLSRDYQAGSFTPVELAAEILNKINQRGEDGVWISKTPDKDVLKRAEELAKIPKADRSHLPLFGMPFSVKDCIDVAGCPTTSGCPAYSYIPSTTHPSIQRAIDLGAIFLGKTNMDQFATGVVGTRTPYGIARNPFDPTYIPGGSSSGAAVSVSSGLCSFAFGTDTGGSGRVPASYNNVIGLKPTLGLFSRAEMVNASRSFDTVSVYALTASDAFSVMTRCAAVSAKDPYSRTLPPNGLATDQDSPKRVAVPNKESREFFGNNEAGALFDRALSELEKFGHRLMEIDFAVFAATGRMMFEDTWLAERYAAVGEFVKDNPDAVDPIVRQVIMAGNGGTAADAFRALYALQEKIHTINTIMSGVDLLIVPTVGTVHTIEAVQKDPINTNALNGYYMNFVNMADMAAIATPNGFLSSGVPMGVTFIGNAFSEPMLCNVADRFHKSRVKALGATRHGFPAE